ncbi:hypothetical protein K491DRAFT_778749 [Lophiostoma macrostomum CBS 122681]|uniref:Uncharacterized protein n=1 Tax=Lophiostoma macrostomum CBS 122681 TaxID=1314788 RepID=A0A6A6T6S0_9PLEO|nr:hypothetical protein K491DRAFT_778749 [Lophiostoma macrostomum CBS 122681]
MHMHILIAIASLAVSVLTAPVSLASLNAVAEDKALVARQDFSSIAQGQDDLEGDALINPRQGDLDGDDSDHFPAVGKRDDDADFFGIPSNDQLGDLGTPIISKRDDADFFGIPGDDQIDDLGTPIITKRDDDSDFFGIPGDDQIDGLGTPIINKRDDDSDFFGVPGDDQIDGLGTPIISK